MILLNILMIFGIQEKNIILKLFCYNPRLKTFLVQGHIYLNIMSKSNKFNNK